VCLCVCPAIRFHSSQRIFSKFGGKPSTGYDTFRGLYILCVHATPACARAVRMYEPRAHVAYRQRFIYRHCVLNNHVYSKRSNGFSPNLLGTYYLLTISVKDYAFVMFTHSARACVRAMRARMCSFAYF
jgi:hypothetical protein